MTSYSLPTGLADQLKRRYAFEIGGAIGLFEGEESVGWQVSSTAEDLFVQLYPTWRTVEEIEWCYEVAAAAALQVPEVVLPHKTSDGSSALVTEVGPVAVFPFVDGVPLDTESEGLRVAAAESLARLHNGMSSAGSLAGTVRPPSNPGAPAALRSLTARTELPDADLDRWEDQLGDDGYARGLIHGDLYPNNVKCAGLRIVGVLDWLEADQDFLSQELGWSIWEFCQNDAGDDLIGERAEVFLATYMRAGGPVPNGELPDAVPFIRRRLRQEVARERLAETSGEPFDPEYADAEIRAFSNLRGRTIDLSG